MNTFLVALWMSLASAAIPTKTTAPKPQKLLAGQGAVTGGLAGAGFSLVNVTLAKTQKKERVVIDLGDIKGAPVRGYPTYYHAELQNSPRRLVIDFSQTATVFIDEKELRQRLKGSTAIAGSSFVLDPTDQTLSLILDLKKNVKAQIFQVPGQKGTSRVVVDLL
ncbi:MAG: hypothetical protein KF802_06300 [Bdellovibrionaceae bacterium]|nr:hypothetical protein [Pseudobdellovibrionaceae bacterium]MBX3032533.1 hypothetical protein [Pseudobdellovibrionaceae bacterium]